MSQFSRVEETSLMTAKLLAVTDVPCAAALYEAAENVVLAEGSVGPSRLLPTEFGPAIEARHRLMDVLLETLSGKHQFVEFAAGLSTRSLYLPSQFVSAHEVDLPAVVELKRKALDATDCGIRSVRLIAGDLGKPECYENLREGLDPELPVALAAEGLLWYLDKDALEQFFRSVGELLEEFGGVFVCGDAPAERVDDDLGHLSPNSKDFDATHIATRELFSLYFENMGLEVEYRNLSEVQDSLTFEPRDSEALPELLEKYGAVGLVTIVEDPDSKRDFATNR